MSEPAAPQLALLERDFTRSLTEAETRIPLERLALSLDRSRENAFQRLFKTSVRIDRVSIELATPPELLLEPLGRLVGFQRPGQKTLGDALGLEVTAQLPPLEVLCDLSRITGVVGRGGDFSVRYCVVLHRGDEIRRLEWRNLLFRVRLKKGKARIAFAQRPDLLLPLELVADNPSVLLGSLTLTDESEPDAAPHEPLLLTLSTTEGRIPREALALVPYAFALAGPPLSTRDLSSCRIPMLQPQCVETFQVWIHPSALPIPASRTCQFSLVAALEPEYPPPTEEGPPLAQDLLVLDLVFKRESWGLTLELFDGYGPYALEGVGHMPENITPRFARRPGDPAVSAPIRLETLKIRDEDPMRASAALRTRQLAVLRLGTHPLPPKGGVRIERAELAWQIPREVSLHDLPEAEDVFALYDLDTHDALEPFDLGGPTGLPEKRLGIACRDTVFCKTSLNGLPIPMTLKLVGRQLDDEGRVQSLALDLRLELPLVNELYEAWLSVDFGTSCIVAATIDREGRPETLPLCDTLLHRDELKALDGRAFASDLLPSDILLEEGKTVREMVSLAPGKSERQREEVKGNRVPCLKILLDHPRIPLRNQEFRYLEPTPEGKMLERVGAPPTSEVLEATFDRLFRLHLLPLLHRRGLAERLQQVIFTLPNAFASQHQDLMKRTLLKLFAQLRASPVLDASGNPIPCRLERLLFISESDAVFYDYYYHWDEWNARGQPSRTEAEVKRLRQKDPEYILVYDLGAGSLDISYLRLSESDDQGPVLEVLARLGLMVAGNTLDTRLAKAVSSYQKGKGHGLRFEVMPQPDETLEAFIARLAYKEYVLETKFRCDDKASPDSRVGERRSEWKMRSNHFLFQGFDEDLTVKDLEAAEEVKGFLRTVTGDALAQLFSLCPDDPDRPFKKGERFPVDTLIATGRTLKFRGVKAALVAAVSTHRAGAAPLFVVSPDDPGKLKRMVATGACLYARHNSRQQLKRDPHPLDARYGLLIRPERRPSWAFVPLLEPGARPARITEEGGVLLREYEAWKLLPMGFGDTVYFIRSFSTDPAAVVRADAGSLSRILLTLDLEEHGLRLGESARVGLRLQASGELHFWIKNDHYQLDTWIPDTTSLYENHLYLESIWPSVVPTGATAGVDR